MNQTYLNKSPLLRCLIQRLGSKGLFILLFIAFCGLMSLLPSCRKDHTAVSRSGNDTTALIQRLSGKYLINYYCSHSTPYVNITYDTTMGELWTISPDTLPGNIKVNNGASLKFDGNLSTKYYHFQYNIGTAGQEILFDSLCSTFTTSWGYSYTNCSGSGTRTP